MNRQRRREVFVVFEPETLTEALLADKTAVVVDVLRATSSILAALAAGAQRVVPTLEVAEARAVRDASPPGTVILGGERDGLPIPGFDVGNSPQEFTPERVRGKTVAITTTNGTRALLMALPAARVYVASLVNVAATARRLAERCAGDVALVTSGTERRVSWEDAFCAGAIVEALGSLGPQGVWHFTDSALIALECWRAARCDVRAALRRGRGGRNVIERGLADAFETCGAVDAINLVARVAKDPLEIVIEH
jgi:2-phosphosulfolactate phosphatase